MKYIKESELVMNNKVLDIVNKCFAVLIFKYQQVFNNLKAQNIFFRQFILYLLLLLFFKMKILSQNLLLILFQFLVTINMNTLTLVKYILPLTSLQMIIDLVSNKTSTLPLYLLIKCYIISYTMYY